MMKLFNMWYIEFFLVKILLIFLLFSSCDSSTTEYQLFDGRTFRGWEGSNKIFRIQENIIVGGSQNTPIDKNYFLCTVKEFENFELRLSAKFKTNDLNVNGGICFRAKRVPKSNEVMGYQADIGYEKTTTISKYLYNQNHKELGINMKTEMTSPTLYPLWGSLCDENRPDRTLYPNPEIFPIVYYDIPNRTEIENIINPNDWNDIIIIAKEKNISIKINGIETASYFEKNNPISKGQICLQTHAGIPHEVMYKDIVIKY